MASRIEDDVLITGNLGVGGALAIPTGGMSVAAGAALGGQIGQQATGGY